MNDTTQHPLQQHFDAFRAAALEAGYKVAYRITDNDSNTFWIHPAEDPQWEIKARLDCSGVDSTSAARIRATTLLKQPPNEIAGPWLQGPKGSEMWWLDEAGNLVGRPFEDFLSETVAYAESVILKARANTVAIERRKWLERSLAGGEGGQIDTPFGSGNLYVQDGQVVCSLALQVPDAKLGRVLAALADAD